MQPARADFLDRQALDRVDEAGKRIRDLNFGAYKGSAISSNSPPTRIIRSFVGYGSWAMVRIPPSKSPAFGPIRIEGVPMPAHGWANFPRALNFFIDRLSYHHRGTACDRGHVRPRFAVDASLRRSTLLHPIRSRRKAYPAKEPRTTTGGSPTPHEPSGIVVVSRYPSQLY